MDDHSDSSNLLYAVICPTCGEWVKPNSETAFETIDNILGNLSIKNSS